MLSCVVRRVIDDVAVVLVIGSGEVVLGSDVGEVGRVGEVVVFGDEVWFGDEGERGERGAFGCVGVCAVVCSRLD